MGRSYDPRRTPWQIDESEFYELESTRAQLAFLLRYAVLAPSGHNTQPWTFRVTGGGVEVHADFSRRLPVADPNDRELLISIGAAIANLRVAAAHFGFDSHVTYGDEPVAFVSLHETCRPDEQLARLFPAITRRHTARTRFEKREIDPEALERICDAIESSDLLRFIVPHERHRAAELVEEADRILMSDERWRSELADWVRPNESPDQDGITGDAFGIPGPLSAFAPWLVRTFDLGETRGKQDRELIEHAAGLIVLTSEDEQSALVRAGQALERFLLTLTACGVQYAFASQPVEVPDLRRELWDLIRTPRPPQVLLRIGYAPVHVRPMPRRPAEVVTV